ncbi:hypothetical protein AB1E18_013593 [Capra hircus]
MWGGGWTPSRPPSQVWLQGPAGPRSAAPGKVECGRCEGVTPDGERHPEITVPPHTPDGGLTPDGERHPEITVPPHTPDGGLLPTPAGAPGTSAPVATTGRLLLRVQHLGAVGEDAAGTAVRSYGGRRPSSLLWRLRLQAQGKPCGPKRLPWKVGEGYLQLKKKLEDEFPSRLDICGEGTPQVTGFFEVFVAGKLVHSKKPIPPLVLPPPGRRWLRGHGEQVSEAGGRHQSRFGSGLMCPEGRDQ